MMGSNYNNADYRATEPLTVDTIKGSFQEVLQDNFLIKINSPINPSVSETTDERVSRSDGKRMEEIAWARFEKCSTSHST